MTIHQRTQLLARLFTRFPALGERWARTSQRVQTLAQDREIGAQEGVDLDAAISRGTFAIASGIGKTTDEASARWEELAWGALGRSSVVLRVVGEMTDALDPQSPPIELVRFEESLNSTIKRFPAVVVCQYDVREFDGKAVLSAIKTHPAIFEMNLGSLIA